MSSLDILFWLLVVLLGGIVWAIEAGLTQRHRNILLSSIGATLVTMVVMMFFVEDTTKVMPLEAQKFAKKKKPQAEGELESDYEEGGGRGPGGGSDSASAGSANEGSASSSDSAGSGSSSSSGSSGQRSSGSGGGGAAKQKQTKQAAKPEDKLDPSTIYSREPFRDCPVCPQIVIVPPGTTQYGSPVNEPGRAKGERSAETRDIENAFAIGRLEVTRAEFDAFAREDGFVSRTQCDIGVKRRGVFNWERPGFEQDERHPVTCLTVDEVGLYLNWLRVKTGRRYRLPTELEWEHAARAGTRTPYSLPVINRHSANVGNSRDGTTVGGALSSNPWGISDQVGNAWELTAECVGAANVQMTLAPGLQGCRPIVKGGSWASTNEEARHASRRLIWEATATNDIGFRVMRELDQRDDDMKLTPEERKAIAKAERDAADLVRRSRAAEDEQRQKAVETAEAEIAAEEAKARAEAQKAPQKK